jgi:hypothetical protein
MGIGLANHLTQRMERGWKKDGTAKMGMAEKLLTVCERGEYTESKR